MSLGWLTESALVPAKATPIEVGKSSILDLQAIVADKEHSTLDRIARDEELGLHKRKKVARTTQSSSKRSKRGGSSKHRRKKHGDGNDEPRNKGVDSRAASDKRARKMAKRLGRQRLLRKVELYNRLKAAGANPVAEDDDHVAALLKQAPAPAHPISGGHEADSDTVSSTTRVPPTTVRGPGSCEPAAPLYAPRRNNSPEQNAKRQLSALPTPDADGMIEFTDEFGRSRRIVAGSQDHQSYLLAARERERQQREQAREAEHQLQQQRQASEARGPRSGLGFAASSRHGGGGTRARATIIDGGVRAQWEVRLANSAREHVADVARETIEGRAAAAARRAALDAHREELSLAPPQQRSNPGDDDGNGGGGSGGGGAASTRITTRTEDRRARQRSRTKVGFKATAADALLNDLLSASAAGSDGTAESPPTPTGLPTPLVTTPPDHPHVTGATTNDTTADTSRSSHLSTSAHSTLAPPTTMTHANDTENDDDYRAVPPPPTSSVEVRRHNQAIAASSHALMSAAQHEQYRQQDHHHQQQYPQHLNQHEHQQHHHQQQQHQHQHQPPRQWHQQGWEQHQPRTSANAHWQQQQQQQQYYQQYYQHNQQYQQAQQAQQQQQQQQQQQHAAYEQYYQHNQQQPSAYQSHHGQPQAHWHGQNPAQ